MHYSQHLLRGCFASDYSTFFMAMTTTLTAAPANLIDNGRGKSTKGRMGPPPSFYQTIDGLIRSHAAEDADIPMIGYPAQSVSDYEIHTAKNVDRYVDAACWWYQKQGLQPAVSVSRPASFLYLTVAGPVKRQGTCRCTSHTIRLRCHSILLCSQQIRLGSTLPFDETHCASICQPFGLS